MVRKTTTASDAPAPSARLRLVLGGRHLEMVYAATPLHGDLGDGVRALIDTAARVEETERKNRELQHSLSEALSSMALTMREMRAHLFRIENERQEWQRAAEIALDIKDVINR